MSYLGVSVRGWREFWNRLEAVMEPKVLPESAWEAIFAEHERDHQHANASRDGCNGCAMLQYVEHLRARLEAAEAVVMVARKYITSRTHNMRLPEPPSILTDALAAYDRAAPTEG